MPLQDTTKVCNKCGAAKPIDQFRHWHAVCRPCQAADRNKYPRNAKADAARASKWNRENKGRRAEITRRWKQKNLAKHASYEAKRRAAKRKTTGAYTDREWFALLEQCNHRCLCCGREDAKLTVDHVIPLSLGGANDISNIQPLCLTCNDVKGTKSTDYRGVRQQRVDPIPRNSDLDSDMAPSDVGLDKTSPPASSRGCGG